MLKLSIKYLGSIFFKTLNNKRKTLVCRSPKVKCAVTPLAIDSDSEDFHLVGVKRVFILLREEHEPDL